jgi:light-regulated signal transduction histidine kinase (bacteriophytochrome)
LLQTARGLLTYSLFAAVLSGVFFYRAHGVAYVVFFPGLLTNLLLANVGLFSRLRLHAKLQTTHQAVLRELGERQRAEAELARTNRELEAFSYSVAHDLRSPLRSLNGFAGILREDYAEKLDDDGKRYLERIQVASDRMGHLIDALLGLARVTRQPLKNQTVDLSALAEAAARQQQAANSARSVEFVCQPGLVAEGDPELLRAVLENLIVNAWKFTAKAASARVTFAATEKDGHREYRVEDNGAGFDMSHASELFSPFKRLHASAEFPGTGIGLATVQRIIERHGGRVRAEGAVGKGATIFFSLPTSPLR